VAELVTRRRRARRRLAVELLRLRPTSRIRIKTGTKSRGPVEFAGRIEAHFRRHLEEIRRQRLRGARRDALNEAAAPRHPVV
jgi:hypothetical protein